MNRYKKGIIISILTAVITTAVFFAALRIFSSKFPFTENTVSVADYEKSDILTAEAVETDGESIRKTNLPELSPNTIIGSADANNTSIEFIFDANDVNAAGRLNISEDSHYIGEIGTVFACCYKSDAAFVASLKVGDTVELNTFYGSYKYEVTAVTSQDSLTLAKKQGDGAGRALVLCTDSSSGVGISDSYLTVVCTMISGKTVTE